MMNYDVKDTLLDYKLTLAHLPSLHRIKVIRRTSK